MATERDHRDPAYVRRLEEKVRVLEGQVDVLLRALQQRGGALGPAAMDDRTLEAFKRLTPKQHASLQMIMRGARNAEIARRLGVTESTAKVHVRGIMRKFGVRTRSQVILQVKSLFDRISPEEYERITGLPRDWDERYDADDPVSRVLLRRVHP